MQFSQNNREALNFRKEVIVKSKNEYKVIKPAAQVENHS